jgi:hypothetical protein
MILEICENKNIVSIQLDELRTFLGLKTGVKGFDIRLVLPPATKASINSDNSLTFEEKEPADFEVAY